MNNFYKGGRGLAFSQREEGTCSRRAKPPRLAETLTNQVREGGADLPSAMARQVVGISSELLRVLFESCSTGLRQLFGKSSAAGRRAAEALPKDSRSCPEAVSNASRSGLEDHPNSGAESDKLLLRRLHISPVGFKYALSTDEVLFTQPLRKPKKSRLMYPECTASVRGVYGKGTEKVLKRYWRGTTEVRGSYGRGTTEVQRSYGIPTAGLHAFGTSAVGRPARKCERMVRFSLRRLFFKEPNDILTPAALSLICFSLKSLLFKATKNKVVFAYGLLWFMLFSLPMAWAQSAETRAAERQTSEVDNRKRIDFERAVINLTEGSEGSPDAVQRLLELYPNADLEKYPLAKYTVDTNYVGFLVVGEEIPDAVLDKPLRVANHPEGEDSITLRAYTDKEWLILDNWAKWCAPCVASMDLWERLMPRLADKVAVLGLHLDFDYKAPIVAQERKWSMPQIIGGEALVLSRYFLGQNLAGPSVWIHKGKLWGISSIKEKDQAVIFDVVNGKLNHIPEEFDPFHRKSIDRGGDRE